MLIPKAHAQNPFPQNISTPRSRLIEKATPYLFNLPILRGICSLSASSNCFFTFFEHGGLGWHVPH